MARHLFIVSRQHPDVYAALRERFREDRNVEVVLDRREGEPGRRPFATTGTERGLRSPQRHAEVDRELTLCSYAVVTMS